MDDDQNLIEEIELKDLEQRIEFGCCGGDSGDDGWPLDHAESGNS